MRKHSAKPKEMEEIEEGVEHGILVSVVHIFKAFIHLNHCCPTSTLLIGGTAVGGSLCSPLPSALLRLIMLLQSLFNEALPASGWKESRWKMRIVHMFES